MPLSVSAILREGGDVTIRDDADAPLTISRCPSGGAIVATDSDGVILDADRALDAIDALWQAVYDAAQDRLVKAGWRYEVKRGAWCREDPRYVTSSTQAALRFQVRWEAEHASS